MVPVRAVGNGLDEELDAAGSRHGLQARLVAPDARRLQDVPGLVERLADSLVAGAAVDGLLAADKRACSP